MKAGRGIYDRGDVSVKTARSARLKNCYKKARKWDRAEMLRVLTSPDFTYGEN